MNGGLIYIIVTDGHFRAKSKILYAIMHTTVDFTNMAPSQKNYKILETSNAGRTLVASQAIKPQEKILTDTALVSSPVIFSGQVSTQPNFFCISCFKICQGKKKCQKCKLPICDKPCSKSKIHVEDCPVLKGGILLIKLTDSSDSDFESSLALLR